MSAITFDNLLFDSDGNLRIGANPPGKPFDSSEREAFKDYAAQVLQWCKGDCCFDETPVPIALSIPLRDMRTWHRLRGSGLIEDAGKNGFSLAPLRDAINASLRPASNATAQAKLAATPAPTAKESKATPAKPRTAIERLAAGAARDLAMV